MYCPRKFVLKKNYPRKPLLTTSALRAGQELDHPVMVSSLISPKNFFQAFDYLRRLRGNFICQRLEFFTLDWPYLPCPFFASSRNP